MAFYYASLGTYLWKTTYLWMDLHRDRDDHPVGVNCYQPGNSGIQLELGARGRESLLETARWEKAWLETAAGRLKCK
jgi:hypothetical protein